MNSSELFDIWAPTNAVWSRWAKPVLFAEFGSVTATNFTVELPALDLHARMDTAVVVDLPSDEAVKVGLALAERGFRPIPVFNGARGPQSLSLSNAALLDNGPIQAWLVAGADLLRRHHLPDNAPPAFLLDSRRRLTGVSALPGRFDNRWIVFPQDFPSANFLRAQQFERVLLLQSEGRREPQEDLAHVLRRWQEGGLMLSVANPNSANMAETLTVNRPPRFRWLWYSALAAVGLHRSSAGGFGGMIPMPSSG